MKRRDLIVSVGSAAFAAAVAKTASAADPEKKDPHADHASPYAKLVAATANCAAKGELCLSHCHMMLAEGDKSMGACAKSVREMIAACRSLEQLAASGSKHTKAMAKLTSTICKECEAECKKHEKHAVCKDCMVSCAACAAECDKV